MIGALILWSRAAPGRIFKLTNTDEAFYIQLKIGGYRIDKKLLYTEILQAKFDLIEETIIRAIKEVEDLRV